VELFPVWRIMTAMDTLLTDLKHALRGLWARPAFTAMVLIPLTLGIGMNTAIFSVVHAVLLRSLPYENPEALVRVWEARPRMGPDAEQMAAFSMQHFRDWRDDNDVFDGMAAYGDASFNLTAGLEPRRIEGQSVSPALFPMLGVEPLRGRYLSADEEVPGNDRVIVLSYDLWQRQFGADESLVGNTILLDGLSYDVIGIMPPSFQFPDRATEFWVPQVMAPPAPMRPGEMRIELTPVMAKLKAGVSAASAEASAETFLNHLRGTSEMASRMNEGVTIHLTSMREQLVRPVRAPLMVLSIAVGFVLLIACANVANLFLVRARSRERDLAVRVALGAGRGRLVGRLLVESLTFGLVGGVLGTIVAFWGVRALRLLRPAELPLLDSVEIDGTVLAFNFAVALVTALVVGAVPALRSAQTDVVSGLKGSSADARHGAPTLLRNALAVAEIVFAIVLFVGAGLMLRSFQALSTVDPGYLSQDVLTFRLNLPATKYDSAVSQKSFYDRLRSELSSLPGVTAAGVSNSLPLDSDRFLTSLQIEGRPPPEDRMNAPRAGMRVVSAGFFQAMGIRVLSGRGFEEGDNESAPGSVVVNQSLVNRYFDNENPVGQRLARMGEIIGVVSDVRQEGLDAEPSPEVYLSYPQVPDQMASMLLANMNVAVRVDPRQSGLVDGVRSRVQAIDAELPLADFRPMDARLADSVARPRLYAALFSIFAALALILATSGVYSVISYTVSQRTRETGVRVAFGATDSDIVRLVLRDGWRILVFGLPIGLALSVVLARFLRSVLFEIEPADPVTFVVVAVLLGGAVLAASVIPARQASKIDAMKALRYE